MPSFEKDFIEARAKGESLKYKSRGCQYPQHKGIQWKTVLDKY
jgi:hypothetical protein